MDQRIQIELSVEKLVELFQQGHLCAGQLRCLTPESKQVVWRLCLEMCGHTACFQESTAKPSSNSSKTLIENELIQTIE
ncbi:hypothetical protein JCM19233_6751 [Vibrio astriarenae]|nr:hypothetical protein JCM19233_6751 [Vibrio sp. C7]